MELVSDSACLLCKQQTTVLKLDNVKSYLDKLFDTFFDKSNIFKDEFQGMVANASLCLMCTPKVNICCNLRNDYEDKYNGKCLQKLLSSTGCLLCDGNSPPLTKTQDMPSSLLEQIELFMNSTSFPESYSNSALCLTCIHSLNIWHEVRSSIMKLRQNDEVDESNNAIDSDATDIANTQKVKTTQTCTTDGGSKGNVRVTNLVDSNAENSENEHSSTLKNAGNVSDDDVDNTYGRLNLSDRSRSESPSLINNKLAKKFRHHQKAQKLLLLNKNVRDKKSLISDSSDSEIDGLNKIVEEIVESYENEQATSRLNSLGLISTKSKSSNSKLNITNIDDSSDSEYQSAVTSHSLSNISSNISLNSPRWISKRKTFTSLRNDSSDSESSMKEKNSQKPNQKLKRRRQSLSLKDSPEPESAKHKRSDNMDRGTVTKIIDSSDEEAVQKNARILKQRRMSTLSKRSPEPESLKHKKSDSHEKRTKIDDSSEEEDTHQNVPKLKCRRLLALPRGSPEPEVLKKKKSDNEKQEITKVVNSSSEDEESVPERNKQTPKPKVDDSSDEERTRRSTQRLKCRRPSTFPRGSSEPEVLKKKSDQDKQEITKVVNSSSEDEETLSERNKQTSKQKINDSSDEERTRRSTQKLKRRRLSTFPRESPEPEVLKKKSDQDKQEIAKVVNSSSEDEETLPERNKQTMKPKIDDSPDENRTRRSMQKLKCRRLSTFPRGSPEPEVLKKKSDKDKREITNMVNSSSGDEETIPERSKQTSKLTLKTGKEKKSNEREETTEGEDSSDNTGTQKLKHPKRSTLPESEATLIEDSSDNESNREPSLRSKHKTRKPENDKEKTKLIDDSSDTESTPAKSAQKLKSSKISRKVTNRKSDDSESSDKESTSRTSTPDLSDKNQSRRSKVSFKPETGSSKKSGGNQKTKIDDSSDSESIPNKSKRRKRLQISSDKNQKEASTISDSSDEFVTKDTTKIISRGKLSTRQQIVLSDSSDQESMKTVPSEFRKKKNVKNKRKRDDLWLYLNKRLNKLRSVKKLHEKKKINLPNFKLDDKFYKQLPYVLLEQKDLECKTNVVEKKFPKIKLKPPQKEPTNEKDNRRTSRRINKSPITITLSDDESDDAMNTSFVDIVTHCCPICDKIFKTLWESKAHDLFHMKPDEVVINVVRENLTELQKEHNRPGTENINKIMAKYLDVSEKNGVELGKNLSNGHSSSSSIAVEDENLEELKMGADSTSSKSRIPLPDEKSSSTSEDNSDCENIPNVINEKRRKLSILLHNSRDKSDNSSPNPKRVRFALDHKTSITNSQSTEDLTKIKSKITKDDVHNLTL